MSSNKPKRTLSWLLAVALLAGNGSLPGYRHSHAGGEVAHDHDKSMQEVVVHEHHHGHSHQQAKSEGRLTATAPHVHLALFGFEVTLPASEESDPASSNSTQDDLACTARIVDDCLRVGGDESSVLVMLACKQVASAVTGTLCHRPQTCKPPMAPTWLLCDAARHERSGVQLF